MSGQHAAFYRIKPGDTLIQLSRLLGGATTASAQRAWVQDLARANHIKNPDRIYHGQVVALPLKLNGRLPEVYPSDLLALEKQVQSCSRSVDPLRYNGDILAELAESTARGGIKALTHPTYDFLKDFTGGGAQTLGNLRDTFAAQTPHLVSARRQAVTEIERITVEILRVRQNTIEYLRATRTSVRTQEIMVLSVKSNGLYAFSQKAMKALEFLDRYKVSNKLFVLDVLTEGAKVTQTYLDTSNVSATARQFAGSAVKVGAGLGMSAFSAYACGVLAPTGPLGWAGCGAIVLGGIFAVQPLGEWAGKAGYEGIKSKLTTLEIPGLP